jgi:hypothetical protein
MFSRVVPVRCFLVLFLLYGLSPLMSPLTGNSGYTETGRLPEFRLFLLDLLGPGTTLPDENEECCPPDPSGHVLVKKKPAALRKTLFGHDIPSLARSWQHTSLFSPTIQPNPQGSWYAEAKDRSGAHIRYIGLDPPLVTSYFWC